MNLRDILSTSREALALGLSFDHREMMPLFEGRFLVEIRDGETGEVLETRVLSNTPTRDSSIYTAMLYASGATPTPPAVRGLTMLALGTGATGALLAPDAADPRQRRLNAELARKSFASTVFRNSVGTAVAYPTNVVDYTTTFSAGEAVGPINEMGLVRTLSLNPATRTPVPATYPTYDATVDLTQYDVLVNYSTCAVISIPAGATFSITWRLTF